MKTLYNQKVLEKYPDLVHGREKRQGGTLHNWKLVSVKPSGAIIAIGYITNDGAWRQYEQIRTSVVVAVDEVNKTLETLNTIYKLE